MGKSLTFALAVILTMVVDGSLMSRVGVVWYEDVEQAAPVHLQKTPPNHNNTVAMARYLIHETDWVSIATISTVPAIKGAAFANIKSMVDGPVELSTGIPYFYLTSLDFTVKDLKKNRHCTITASLDETDFCRSNNLDAEDPRCARIIMSGKMETVHNDTKEYGFAKDALFQRHPSMADYPPDHGFFVGKLNMTFIALIDWYGGAQIIPVQEYLDYNYRENQPEVLFRNAMNEDISVKYIK